MPSPSTHQEEIEHEILAVESPEGRPEHPEVGARSLVILMGLAAFGLVILAVVLGMVVSPLAAVAVGVFAVLLTLVNPVFWATFSRSKERREVHMQVERSQLRHAGSGEGPA